MTEEVPAMSVFTRHAADRPDTQAAVRHPRSVERLVAGTPTSDGAGPPDAGADAVAAAPARPDLMLDARQRLARRPPRRFSPDHPHRGFETGPT